MPEDIESKWLSDLLAAVHGDEGQYQLLHGTERAVSDAIQRAKHGHIPSFAWRDNFKALNETRGPVLAALLVELWQNLDEEVNDHAPELQENLQRLGILVQRTEFEMRECHESGECTCSELFNSVDEMVRIRNCYRVNPLIELPKR